MINLIKWIKANLTILLEFLKENFIEIHIKSKKTEETVKHIKISNIFVVVCIVFACLLVIGIMKWV